MFRRVLCEKVVIVIVVYVDDLLVESETKRDEEQAMKDLRCCFPIKGIGEAGFHLGCRITDDRDAGTLKLDQHRYVRTVASKFNVEKTSTMPAAAGAKPLSKDDAPQTEAETEEICVIPYREVVGALMWAATMTHLDVAYATYELGKFNDNLGPVHWGEAKRALVTISVWHEGRWDHLRRNARVVHKTVGMGGHRFRHLPRHSAFGFRRSGDAGGAINWFSRVQKVTAAVSSESEYVALAEVVNELRFLRQGKGFLTPPIDDDIVIREDNEGAINRFSSRRTRHVDVKHHIVRDAVESGIVQIHYVKSGEQHADMLTKALNVNTSKTHARFFLTRGQDRRRSRMI